MGTMLVFWPAAPNASVAADYREVSRLAPRPLGPERGAAVPLTDNERSGTVFGFERPRLRSRERVAALANRGKRQVPAL